jgi:plasmid stabilization system protein ParE
MTLVFSSVFEQDFAELVTLFLPEVSVRFERNTYKLIHLLRQNPEMGRVRKDLRPDGIRSFRVRGFNRYLLFYQIRGDELLLLRLRYAGMDLQSFFT